MAISGTETGGQKGIPTPDANVLIGFLRSVLWDARDMRKDSPPLLNKCRGDSGLLLFSHGRKGRSCKRMNGARKGKSCG